LILAISELCLETDRRYKVPGGCCCCYIYRER